MDNMELGEVQLRFAELVWHYAPLPSGELVKICQRELNWKKPTTYTVLRKLCEKGLFKNENGLVSVVMTQEQFYAARSEQFVEDAFDGSLPAFITAFTSRKKLSAAEVDEIQRMEDTVAQVEGILIVLLEQLISLWLCPFCLHIPPSFPVIACSVFLL